MPHNICLFAFYNPTNTLPLDVQHYLRQLTLCGWQVHLAISGHASLSPDIQDFCQEHAIIPHLRANQGLDFGAWQDLINQGVTENADHILLTNDSVFGPLYPLQPIFRNMMTPKTDIWGMVESFEVNWHLQSWFLCFNHTTFHHPKIQELFSQPFATMNKPDIIRKGELQLGKTLHLIPGLTYQCSGLSPTGFRPFRHRKQINPMHLDWYTLLQSGGVPFIKKELIRDNHFGIFWLNHYRQLLKENPYFPLSYIDHYLEDFPNRPLPFTPWWKRIGYLFTSRDHKLAWKYFMKQGVSCPILP